MTGLRARLTRAMDARNLGGAPLGPHEIAVRQDIRVPMDDGVELLADLLSPVPAPAQALPTIIVRGPYGRRGFMIAGVRGLVYAGFTVLIQSSRGTGGSGGSFHPQVDEQRDGVATLRWVRAQPWYTGRLVTYGASYLGYTQWATVAGLGADESELAPDALCLITTMADFGATTWDNGAFSLSNALGWTRMMQGVLKGRPMLLSVLPTKRFRRALDTLPLEDGDAAAVGGHVDWYQDWVGHERVSDRYWARQSHTSAVTKVTAPVYMITGWYDIFLPWQIDNYQHLVDAGNQPRLTIGPWGHSSAGLRGPAHEETIAFLMEHFGEGSPQREKPVRAFLTGAAEWRDLEAWPPSGASPTTWHLHGSGALSEQTADAGTSRFDYNPDDATPAVGGPSLEPGAEPKDNAPHERRGDVVVFRSAVLDRPLEIAGTPTAGIRFRSSRPSFDVFVRITDVHPDGRSVTVTDGIRRIGAHGTTATDPTADDEGWREVSVALWPSFHRFAAGHRVGVQISSGAHPRYARNPGSAAAAAEATSLGVAHQEIAYGDDRGSRIILPTWRGDNDQIPHHN